MKIKKKKKLTSNSQNYYWIFCIITILLDVKVHMIRCHQYAYGDNSIRNAI